MHPNQNTVIATITGMIIIIYTPRLVSIYCRGTLCIQRGVCYGAVSVCPSVTFVYCVETSKHILKVFTVW